MTIVPSKTLKKEGIKCYKCKDILSDKTGIKQFPNPFSGNEPLILNECIAC